MNRLPLAPDGSTVRESPAVLQEGALTAATKSYSEEVLSRRLHGNNAVVCAPDADTCTGSKSEPVRRQRPISDPIEAKVFDFYVKEAGRWLDIVSPSHHMAKTVSVLALSDPLLYSACLAYASHVLCLLDRSDKATEERYNDIALNLLIAKLSEDPQRWAEGSVLSTTVLLRVSEQFSEIGDDQQYHLNGAFSVSASAGRKWSVDHLSLETTAFWTYLRMTVRVCFLCEQGTKCDMNLIRDDSSIVHPSEAAITNSMSQLLAMVCNACWTPTGDIDHTELKNLTYELHRWKARLTHSFEPWASYDMPGGVFRTVKFFDSWHVIAWQFFHAAEVLLAVYLARFSPQPTIIAQNQYLEREVLVPTRQLCAITFSDEEMGTQINGPALVAWCGQFLTSKDEQQALVRWLDELMAKTRWPNKTCSDRLKRIWSGQQSCWTAHHTLSTDNT